MLYNTRHGHIDLFVLVFIIIVGFQIEFVFQNLIDISSLIQFTRDIYRAQRTFKFNVFVMIRTERAHIVHIHVRTGFYLFLITLKQSESDNSDKEND